MIEIRVYCHRLFDAPVGRPVPHAMRAAHEVRHKATSARLRASYRIRHCRRFSAQSARRVRFRGRLLQQHHGKSILGDFISRIRDIHLAWFERVRQLIISYVIEASTIRRHCLEIARVAQKKKLTRRRSARRHARTSGPQVRPLLSRSAHYAHESYLAILP